MTRSRRAAAAGLVAMALAFAGFVALGTWQLERRAWKLDLIERVEQRVHAPAVAIPTEDRWGRINAADDEYRHVRATGRFLDRAQTLVQATTELGAGHWVLTPLMLPDGSAVFVNRGFVPPADRGRVVPGAGATGGVTVTGLLRINEPDGGFLRRNDPAADRWHSRDVRAMAAARGLVRVAPFFIDAEAAPNAAVSPASPGEPVPGLTVIVFRNHHLVYAVTWYALALMVAGAGVWLVRGARHSRVLE